jgi:hypothetical protein
VDDDGLHASASVMTTGAIELTLLDRRTTPFPGSTALVVVPDDRSVDWWGVAAQQTVTATMRTPMHYSMSIYGQPTDVLSLDIVMPEGRGGGINGYLEALTANGTLTLPANDNIGDVISLPGVPDDAAIYRTRAGSVVLDLRNQEKDRVTFAIPTIAFKLAVGRLHTQMTSVNLSAGTYLMQATNQRTHAVATVYLYVVP